MPESTPSQSDSQSRSAWLERHHDETQRAHYALRRAELRWAWARLLSFAAIVAAWYPLASRPAAAGLVSAAAFAAFVACVRRHRRLRADREAADRLLALIDESRRRCGGRVVLIRDHARPTDPDDPDANLHPLLDPGPGWPLTDQERDDLDLYAPPVGLFGLLNRTSTRPGARRLRDWLDQPCLCPDHLRARQAAVAWLKDRPAERLRMMAAVAALRRHDEWLERLILAILRVEPLPRRIPCTLLRLWSLASGAFALVALYQFLGGNGNWGVGLLALLAFNSLVFLPLRRLLRSRLDPWRNTWSAAEGVALAARRAAIDLPDETQLGDLRRAFAAVAPRHVLPSLARRASWADAGGAFHTLLNVVLFFDLHAACAIMARALPYRDALLDALAAMADLEALASLACFAWEQPVAAFPGFADAPALTIDAGLHPLIEPAEAVPNDLRLHADTRVWLITGSNMAGKSTFLRMAGINTLLAQVGSAVPARAMTLSLPRLMTDLRARDNLAHHESYFMAEVRQLRRMILPPPDAAPLLGLIDEPFRGTNSQDQTAAGIAVVGHLIASGHFFLIATHERRLTDLADDHAAANFHFQEDLSAAGPVFDYRLRPGPARTRNALRILEREGYPPAITAAALAWLCESGEDNPPQA